MEWGEGRSYSPPSLTLPFRITWISIHVADLQWKRLLSASASIRAGKPPEASTLSGETEDEKDGNLLQGDSADSSDTAAADAASLLRKSKT